jgi:hypothetical protein
VTALGSIVAGLAGLALSILQLVRHGRVRVVLMIVQVVAFILLYQLPAPYGRTFAWFGMGAVAGAAVEAVTRRRRTAHAAQPGGAGGGGSA